MSQIDIINLVLWSCLSCLIKLFSLRNPIMVRRGQPLTYITVQIVAKIVILALRRWEGFNIGPKLGYVIYGWPLSSKNLNSPLPVFLNFKSFVAILHYWHWKIMSKDFESRVWWISSPNVVVAGGGTGRSTTAPTSTAPSTMKPADSVRMETSK